MLVNFHEEFFSKIGGLLWKYGEPECGDLATPYCDGKHWQCFSVATGQSGEAKRALAKGKKDDAMRSCTAEPCLLGEGRRL